MKISKYCLLWLLVAVCAPALSRGAPALREPARKVTRSSEDELRRKAAAGDVHAQVRLGNAYFYGRDGRRKNPVQAVHWYRRAAAQGAVEAVYNLAVCSEQGLGMPQNVHQAVKLYQEAAGRKLPRAQLRYAQSLLRGVPAETVGKDRLPAIPPDPARAIPMLKALADSGDSEAGREMALLVLSGVTKGNLKTAFVTLRRLADSGDVPSMIGVANCYLNGIGCERDLEKRLRYLRAAAPHDVAATSHLARAYEYGFGVKPDPRRAFSLHRAAAVRGSVPSLVNVGDAYLFGEFTPQDIPGALRCYRRAAQAGNARAMYKLAMCLADGLGGRRDPAEALSLLQKAAQSGHADAQYQLSVVYREGRGVPADSAAARFWLEKAARARQVDAMRELRQSPSSSAIQ